MQSILSRLSKFWSRSLEMSSSEIHQNKEEEAKQMSAVKGWKKKEQRNLYVV